MMGTAWPTRTVAQTTAGRDFVIHLTPGVAKGSCRGQKYQVGAFGGEATQLPDTKASGEAIAVPTGLQGQPATSLRVALWCRGYSMVLIDVPSLPASTFQAQVSLVPLNDVPFSGKVSASADGISMVGATLRVFYQAPWLCRFFGWLDCLVPQWEVSAGTIRDDSTFAVMVPDFAADPAILAAVPSAIGGLGVRAVPGVTPPAEDRGVLLLRADRRAAPYNWWLGSLPLAARYVDMALQPSR